MDNNVVLDGTDCGTGGIIENPPKINPWGKTNNPG
jgi:hypothetical protein